MQPEATPTISVVIPLHDKGATVTEAVASALGQTLDDPAGQSCGGIEVIVVDDGSRDDGGERVRALRHPRLTCLHQENAGVSAARNRGIMAARAPWIAFLDADDVWAPGHLAGLWRAAREGLGQAGPPALCFANVRMEGGGRAGPRLDPSLPPGAIDDYFAFALAHGGYPNMTSATMVRRDAAQAAGLFTLGVGMGEDVDMWCRLALAGPVRYAGGTTAIYREGAAAGQASPYRVRAPEFPVFAAVLPDWEARGLVPPRLSAGAARYAHFLVLEHARQLLDAGRPLQAREVLLRHGRPALDPARYARRMLRTFPAGRTLLSLRRRVAGIRANEA